MNRQILKIAIPSIISNITIPLVGIVDLMIAGAIGGDTLIGGIAIGATIFNFLYWNFGFLRMGTGGFAAQAYGSRDLKLAAQILVRAVTVALIIGTIIMLLQHPIHELSLRFMGGNNAILRAASDYFYIRIWAAPATLAMYAFKGWFIGMQNAKTPMWIAIFINVANVILSIFFAFDMDMGISGVALGTTIAQWSGFLMSAIAIRRYYWKIFDKLKIKGLYAKKEMLSFFKVNIDIFIRTFCLVMVFVSFTIISSGMGEHILAANTLILQLFTLFSYGMDGFGYAAEALAGKYYGAKNKIMLRKVVLSIIKWGVYVSLVSTIAYAFWGENILSLFNPSALTLERANDYIVWASAIPLMSFLAFLIDGVLVGITASSIMRNVMIISTIIFFTLYFSLNDLMGNNALWLSFIVYLFLRGILQLILFWRRMVRL